MKAVTRDQSREVIGRITRCTKWEELDGEILEKEVIEMPEEEFGRRFTQWMNNGMNFVMKVPGTLVIDRTKPFDPAKFIGDSWNIWRGEKDGKGLKGDEQQDTRSLALTEINFAQVLFTACLNKGETAITGEEKLNRHIAAEHIRFDAKIGQTLYEEKGQATLEWLYQTTGIIWFELPGTVLRSSEGDRGFLCLYRRSGGQWEWLYRWLGNSRVVKDPSAVLVK